MPSKTGSWKRGGGGHTPYLNNSTMMNVINVIMATNTRAFSNEPRSLFPALSSACTNVSVSALGHAYVIRTQGLDTHFLCINSLRDSDCRSTIVIVSMQKPD